MKNKNYKPISDIIKMVEYRKKRGFNKIEKILITKFKLENVIKSKEVKERVTAWVIKKYNSEKKINIDILNEFLLVKGLPIIDTFY